MEIQAEIIYGAIAALSAAIVVMWRKISTSEEDCRKQLNELWKTISDLRPLHQSILKVMEHGPDRRRLERRNGSNSEVPFGKERRSNLDRRQF